MCVLGASHQDQYYHSQSPSRLQLTEVGLGGVTAVLHLDHPSLDCDSSRSAAGTVTGSHNGAHADKHLLSGGLTRCCTVVFACSKRLMCEYWK